MFDLTNKIYSFGFKKFEKQTWGHMKFKPNINRLILFDGLDLTFESFFTEIFDTNFDYLPLKECCF